jgi:hypothetical protein
LVTGLNFIRTHPYYHQAAHLEAPRSFEDWARFDYLQPNLLDITNDYRRCVSRFQEFPNLAYPLPGRRRLPAPVRRFAQWRLDHQYFAFPLELSLCFLQFDREPLPRDDVGSISSSDPARDQLTLFLMVGYPDEPAGAMERQGEEATLFLN